MKNMFVIFSSYREYEFGYGWEIYPTKLPACSSGLSFITVARKLYALQGVLLIALEIFEDDSESDNRPTPSTLVVNPAGYVIPDLNDVRIVAYAIAKDKQHSDLSQLIFDDTSPALHMLGRAAPAVQRAEGVPLKEHSQTYASVQNEGSLEGISTVYLREEENKFKLEIRNLRMNYYIEDNPAELSAATVRKNIFAEFPEVKDHIVIITKNLLNVIYLVRSLRARDHGELRYIVLLSPAAMPADLWRQLSAFQCILYSRGAALDEMALIRAGIYRAKKVIVLVDELVSATSHHRGSGSGNGTSALVGAESVFAFNTVRRLNPIAHVVVEIFNETSVGYMEMTGEVEEDSYSFRPQYAAGAYFVTTVLDSLVSQVSLSIVIFCLIG